MSLGWEATSDHSRIKLNGVMSSYDRSNNFLQKQDFGKKFVYRIILGLARKCLTITYAFMRCGYIGGMRFGNDMSWFSAKQCANLMTTTSSTAKGLKQIPTTEFFRNFLKKFFCS